MYRICKKYNFEMAHKLSSSYSEECQQIHGHSYKLEVTIESRGLNEDGMVIDFKKLNEIMESIIKKYDHNCLIEGKTCDYNPTAENMAKFIFYEIDNEIKKNYVGCLLKIRLWETEKAYVEYWH